MTKEGGKVNEDCHPRGRGRGRQEGVKRDGGRVKEGTSGPRAASSPPSRNPCLPPHRLRLRCRRPKGRKGRSRSEW